MLKILLILAFVLLILHYLLRLWRIRRYVNAIPGPPGYYLIGNLLDVYGNSADIFKKTRLLSSKYKIYRLWFSYVPGVCFTTPEDIEVVISSMKNTEKGRVYNAMLLWLSTGLLTSSGGKWRARRKILTPTFHFNILQDFVNVFVRQTEVLLKELEPLSGDKGFDVTPVLTNFTLRTICETAMGIRLDVKNDLQQKYENGIRKMGDMVIHRVMRPWLYEDFAYIFFPSYWKQLRLSKILHKFSHTIIKKRESKIEELSSSQIMHKKRTIMLDMLLLAMKNGELLDFDGIREEVDTFVFEGHDTTSIALGFTLILLANHPEIQTKVYQEVYEVFGDSTDLPTFEDLQKLPYLEMCIKESLRLYPSVPMIARRSSCEFVTPSGYRIPENAELFVFIYDLHHNPDVYPDPEKFDPERFSPEASLNRHPFAYLAFSGGPRNCIGQKFAMLEMKSVISGIIRKYVLEPIDTPDSITLTEDFMLRSKNGIRLRIKPRECCGN